MNIPLFNSFENLNVSNKQSFQGLWGKTSRSSDFDQVLGIPKVEEVCYYYPFNDETPEQIQSVIDKNTEAYIDESEDTPKYKIRDCKVCTTLPFQELHYINYATLSPKSKLNNRIKIIHSFVKDKFVTNEYGPNQESAKNDEVAQKLNLKI